MANKPYYSLLSERVTIIQVQENSPPWGSGASPHPSAGCLHGSQCLIVGDAAAIAWGEDWGLRGAQAIQLRHAHYGLL